MGRQTKLNDATRHVIVDAIRSGAYDWVAAEAAGIDPFTFRRWMADERPLYRAFRAEVEQARASARRVAEARVFKENPLAWLRLGPGRERPGREGWTESHEVTGAGGGPLKHEVEHRGGPDLSRLDGAELETLEALLGKAAVPEDEPQGTSATSARNAHSGGPNGAVSPA